MGTLNPNIPTAELSNALTKAAELREQYGTGLLTPQLLLLALLSQQKSAAQQILRRLSADRGFSLAELERRVEMMAGQAPGTDAKFNFTDDYGKHIPLAEEMLVVLDEALSIAQAREELKAGSGHALAAMAQPGATSFAVLQRVGITSAAVIVLLDEVTAEGDSIIRDFVAEARQGEATPVFQREELLRELISLLSLASRRHVILVGPAGSGRRTLAYSLALLLAEGKGPKDLHSLVAISESALLEDPLAAVRVGLRRASGGVLLLPDIGRFFGDRLRARFPEQVNREIYKALLGEDQVVIGTTTPAAYDQLQAEPIIRQNVQRLQVPPATKSEAIAMLSYHRQRLEQEYQVEVTLPALETAASLASQYIKGTALPAAAVQLADRASALVRMVAQEQVANQPEVKPDGRLDSDDVMVAASAMTGIPISKLSPDEQGRYAQMEEVLHQRIIGQDQAVSAVSRAVKTARVGLREPKRPIGSFLFLGPSGVGKSELAKALAEFMFGSDSAMLVLDMSEYQEEASINRLIGAPPGYVGYEGGGQLTDYVRDHPYTVVLLDEVEKAHARVLDVLLQVMDEGRLTDGQGRTTTFSETVVIMTSNLGAEYLLEATIGDREREAVRQAVRRFFRPEFLNRLDEIIFFHRLADEELAEILDLMLKKEFELAARQGIALTVSAEARRWLLAQNNQPEFGARPLRRIIARFLREPLADFLLQYGPGEEQLLVTVAGSADGLGFEAKRGETALAEPD